MKRILDCNGSDFSAMKGPDLKASIRAAEGRTLLSELILSVPSPYEDVSSLEVARALGAALLLLNPFGVDHPRISGLPDEEGEHGCSLPERLAGRPRVANLWPIDPLA